MSWGARPLLHRNPRWRLRSLPGQVQTDLVAGSSSLLGLLFPHVADVWFLTPWAAAGPGMPALRTLQDPERTRLSRLLEAGPGVAPSLPGASGSIWQRRCRP